jgi:hypothetical protein
LETTAVVENSNGRTASDGDVLAETAPALGATDPSGRSRDVVAELVRRIARFSVQVGAARWLPTGGRPVRSTLLWALAEARIGRSGEAFDLLGSVIRHTLNGRALAPDERAFADRLTFAPGSFFTHDIPSADVVLMGLILHD